MGRWMRAPPTSLVKDTSTEPAKIYPTIANSSRLYPRTQSLIDSGQKNFVIDYRDLFN
jgi:hypothetical protein